MIAEYEEEREIGIGGAVGGGEGMHEWAEEK